MLTDSTRKYLCRIVGLYDKKPIMSLATVLCLSPENVDVHLYEITGNGLAAGCQLFYRKIFGYILQCVIKIRRFYGKIPGIWLPVHLRLFLRVSSCKTILAIKVW